MTRINPFRLLIALPLIFAATTISAQPVHKTASYEIVLKGTSNLHDWSMKAAGAGLEANFTVLPTKIASVNPPMIFNLPVKSLKSNESSMDSRAYNALNANKFPNITFRLVSAVTGAATGNHAPVRANGQLTISGTTRDIVLNATTVTNPDGSVQITGTQTIRFSEYGLKAPSFMLGALRCGDELTITYNVRFN
ncbi:MAG: YceI family protein [Chitinophagaceae bacterium]|nr:MAG: YceI family protein [Chitinophagaceae bacterium]